MSGLAVEKLSAQEGPACECCGGVTRLVRGSLSSADGPQAAYVVRWTVGAVDDHGASFDLALGPWGEGASAADRSAVAVELRRLDNGEPGFMVVDAAERGELLASVASKPLAREDVVGTALAGKVFALLDAIWLGDDRLGELR